jgi:hypothetical protein
MAGVDPISLAVIGAGIGAISSPDDPIKGAILGGAGGFAGGSLLGAAGGGAAAGSAAGTAASTAGAAAGTAAAVPAGTSTYASMIPGLSSAAPGSQAAMLAAQTQPFGIPGLTATGSAASGAAGVSPITAGFWNAANAATSPAVSQGMQGMRMAQGLMNQQQQGQRTAYAPPQLNRGREVNSAAPVLGLLQNQPVRRRQMSLLG